MFEETQEPEIQSLSEEELKQKLKSISSFLSNTKRLTSTVTLEHYFENVTEADKNYLLCYTDTERRTLMARALEYSKYSAAKTLLDLGAVIEDLPESILQLQLMTINAQVTNHSKPAHLPLEHLFTFFSEADTKYLLEQNNRLGQTLLTTACKYGNHDAAATLIDLGANVGSRCFGNNLPIFHAAFAKNFDIVKLILSQNPEQALETTIAKEDLNIHLIDLVLKEKLNPENSTVDLELASMLITNNCDLNHNISFLKNQDTPLIFSIRNSIFDLTSLIINSRDIDLKATNKEGKTAFDVAAKKYELTNHGYFKEICESLILHATSNSVTLDFSDEDCRNEEIQQLIQEYNIQTDSKAPSPAFAIQLSELNQEFKKGRFE